MGKDQLLALASAPRDQVGGKRKTEVQGGRWLHASLAYATVGRVEGLTLLFANSDFLLLIRISFLTLRSLQRPRQMRPVLGGHDLEGGAGR